MQLKDLFQHNTPFNQSLKQFFDTLNIRIKAVQDKPFPIAAVLKERYNADNETHKLIHEVYFIGLMEDSTFDGATLDFNTTLPALDALRSEEKDYDAMAIFGITLHPRTNGLPPSRSQLADLTRVFNQAFPTLPVTIVFHYEQHLAIANCERLKYKNTSKLGEKTGKVSLLKDISLEKTHAGHLRILESMKMPTTISSFKDAYKHWLKVFDTKILNDNFYAEISKWFDWVTDTVVFNDENDKKSKSVNTIKIINRLLFIWFLKEKGLISKNLFKQKFVASHLNDDLDDESNSYYVGVLSNLFFNTVNEKIENRFRKFDVISTMMFKDFDLIKQELNTSPFVNGGLFDETKADCCMTIQELQTLKIPNKYFFGENKNIDLSHHFENSKKHQNETILGIVDLFESYKFTIEENTPYDVEIALDPELLGKIFENLLASYNEETKSTARKATGSYYTPREIVEYMVDQSLTLYLQNTIFPNQLSPIIAQSSMGGFGKTTSVPQVNLFGEAKPVQRTFEDAFREEQKMEIVPTETRLPIDTEAINNFKNDLADLLSYATDGVVSDNFKSKYRDKVLDALDTLKILDPAVGSGAFPMGILQKITLLLKRLDPNNARWLQRMLDRIPNTQVRKATAEKWKNENTQYLRKLGIIESSIYGIDLQPLAVQISKLRFFISLVIEQNINSDASKNYGIEPLPNLDFKFICTNTLIDAPVPPVVPPRFEGIMNEFQKNVSTYFTAVADDKKEVKKRILENINSFIDINDTYIQQLIKQIRAESGSGSAAKVKKAREQMEQLQHASQLWYSYRNIFDDKPIQFFKTEYLYPDVAAQGGFDLVIANPPYIKEHTSTFPFDGIRKQEYYQGKMDLWYYFACHNLDLLKKETGILSFIATNNWVTNSGASILRNKITETAKIISLIDFSDYKIFESADIQTMIMTFQNLSSEKEYKFELGKIQVKDVLFSDIIDLLHKNASDKYELGNRLFNRELLFDEIFVFNNDLNDEILSKIKSKQNFEINPRLELMSGIDVGQDFVNKASKEKLGDNFKVGDGIFVLSNDEIEKKKIPNNELNLLKPYYTTKELGKFYGNPTNSYSIIYTNSSFKNEEKILKYPNVKEHLDLFKTVITSENGNYGLNRAREEDFFMGEKIMSVRKCARPTFTYTDFDCYVTRAFFSIKTNRVNQKYLVSILNSNVVTFWLKNKGKMQGLQYQIDKEPLLNIPIFVPDEAAQQPFISLVEKILQGKKDGIDTSEWEREIDEKVYALYDLSPEEVAIVEGR